MPRNSIFNLVGIAFFVVGGARIAQAQPAFSRTILVDPTATTDANYTKIQDAINAVPANPAVRYTILIYAGTYDTQAITLDDTKENVDLVGVDREAVIIKPPANTDAITIEGFGARNNTIRNLTIITDDDDQNQGRGIVIKQPDQGTGDDPSAIKIIGVTIKVEGEKSTGIDIEDPAEDIEIRGFKITRPKDYGNGIRIAGGTAANPNKDIRIIDGTIRCDGASNQGVHVPNHAQDVHIRRVTIELIGAGRPAIEASNCTGMRVSDCTLLIFDGPGLVAGDDCRVTDSVIIIDRSFGETDSTLDDTRSISAIGKSGLRVSGCKLRGRRNGIALLGNCTDVVVSDCDVLGSNFGVELECGDEILFQGCVIAGNSAVGGDNTMPVADYHGVLIDDKQDPGGCEPGKIRFVSCDIRCLSSKTDLSAYAVRLQAAPPSTDGPIQFIDCAITSQATAAASPGPNDAKSFGVVADEADAVALIGGSVTSSDADEREADQFDLLNSAASGVGIRVSGTKLSKWKGPILASGRKQSVVQRMLNVAQGDPAKLADSADLDGVPIDPGLAGVLATYRALKVTWNNASREDITITVSGINWAGDDIAEEFELSVGSPAKEGSKPFRIVETIYIPDAPGTISVGTTSKLGLYYPISADSDVLQEARLVSDVYTTQAVGTVDAVYSTVVPSTFNDGDSFEWAILASQ